MRLTNIILERRRLGGAQRVYKFDNGYGASVVRNRISYGSERGLYELAVIAFDVPDDPEDWHVFYNTPITDDVIGELSDEEVDAVLVKIEALPKLGTPFLEKPETSDLEKHSDPAVILKRAFSYYTSED